MIKSPTIKMERSLYEVAAILPSICMQDNETYENNVMPVVDTSSVNSTCDIKQTYKETTLKPTAAVEENLNLQSNSENDSCVQTQTLPSIEEENDNKTPTIQEWQRENQIKSALAWNNFLNSTHGDCGDIQKTEFAAPACEFIKSYSSTSSWEDFLQEQRTSSYSWWSRTSSSVETSSSREVSTGDGPLLASTMLEMEDRFSTDAEIAEAVRIATSLQELDIDHSIPANFLLPKVDKDMCIDFTPEQTSSEIVSKETVKDDAPHELGNFKPKSKQHNQNNSDFEQCECNTDHETERCDTSLGNINSGLKKNVVCVVDSITKTADKNDKCERWHQKCQSNTGKSYRDVLVLESDEEQHKHTNTQPCINNANVDKSTMEGQSQIATIIGGCKEHIHMCGDTKGLVESYHSLSDSYLSAENKYFSSDELTEAYFTATNELYDNSDEWFDSVDTNSNSVWGNNKCISECNESGGVRAKNLIMLVGDQTSLLGVDHKYKDLSDEFEHRVDVRSDYSSIMDLTKFGHNNEAMFLSDDCLSHKSSSGSSTVNSQRSDSCERLPSYTRSSSVLSTSSTSSVSDYEQTKALNPYCAPFIPRASLNAPRSSSQTQTTAHKFNAEHDTSTDKNIGLDSRMMPPPETTTVLNRSRKNSTLLHADSGFGSIIDTTGQYNTSVNELSHNKSESAFTSLLNEQDQLNTHKSEELIPSMSCFEHSPNDVSQLYLRQTMQFDKHASNALSENDPFENNINNLLSTFYKEPLCPNGHMWPNSNAVVKETQFTEQMIESPQYSATPSPQTTDIAQDINNPFVPAPYACDVKHSDAEFISIEKCNRFLEHYPTDPTTYNTIQNALGTRENIKTLISASQRVVRLCVKKSIKGVSDSSGVNDRRSNLCEGPDDGEYYAQYGTGFVYHIGSDYLNVRTHEAVVNNSEEALEADLAFELHGPGGTHTIFIPGKCIKNDCGVTEVADTCDVDFKRNTHSQVVTFRRKTPKELIPYMNLFHDVPRDIKSSFFEDSCYFTDTSSECLSDNSLDSPSWGEKSAASKTGTNEFYFHYPADENGNVYETLSRGGSNIQQVNGNCQSMSSGKQSICDGYSSETDCAFINTHSNQNPLHADKAKYVNQCSEASLWNVEYNEKGHKLGKMNTQDNTNTFQKRESEEMWDACNEMTFGDQAETSSSACYTETVQSNESTFKQDSNYNSNNIWSSEYASDTLTAGHVMSCGNYNSKTPDIPSTRKMITKKSKTIAKEDKRPSSPLVIMEKRAAEECSSISGVAPCPYVAANLFGKSGIYTNFASYSGDIIDSMQATIWPANKLLQSDLNHDTTEPNIITERNLRSKSTCNYPEEEEAPQETSITESSPRKNSTLDNLTHVHTKRRLVNAGINVNILKSKLSSAYDSPNVAGSETCEEPWDVNLINFSRDFNFQDVTEMLDNVLNEADPPRTPCCSTRQFESFTHGDLKSVMTKNRPSASVDKKSIIISHPHGGPKVASFGFFSHHYHVGGDLYDTPTCMGSCGAPVLTMSSESFEHETSDRLYVSSLVHAGTINVNGITTGMGVVSFC